MKETFKKKPETVEFKFNGKTYKVEPDALIRFIVEEENNEKQS